MVLIQPAVIPFLNFVISTNRERALTALIPAMVLHSNIVHYILNHCRHILAMNASLISQFFNNFSACIHKEINYSMSRNRRSYISQE
ncbi:Replication origin-binding protein [Dirofilaria immitis]